MDLIEGHLLNHQVGHQGVGAGAGGGQGSSLLFTCGISMAGAFILQLRDTMSLIKADLGSVCVQ